MLWDIREVLHDEKGADEPERIVAPKEPSPVEITQKREKPKSLDAELVVIDLGNGSVGYLREAELDWIVAQAKKTGALIVPFEAAMKFYAAHARWTKNRKRSEGDGASDERR